MSAAIGRLLKRALATRDPLGPARARPAALMQAMIVRTDRIA
ncbi:MAG: hypothetical protein JWQ46_738 [Phenylobacterium sp.]|nr:hypothetical protein [Phenylobacterium sp.]